MTAEMIGSIRDILSGFYKNELSSEESENALNAVLDKGFSGEREERKMLAEGLAYFSDDSIKPSDGLCSCFLYSALYYLTKDDVYVEKLIKDCLDSDILDKENHFFIFQQLNNVFFNEKDRKSRKIQDLMDDLYESVYQEYRWVLSMDEYGFIAEEDRNSDLVLVLTSQYLSMSHAPSKRLLDYCYILQKKLGKRVLVINTAEVIPLYGAVNWFRGNIGNYADEYNEAEYLEYKGERFVYFQCPRQMPDERIIEQLLKLVENKKPLMAIHIGGGSIVSDMISGLIPVITFNTVVSGRAETRGRFSAIGRKPDEDDLHWAERHGKAADHFISYILTYIFKPQKHHYTRAELGFPEDKKTALVVGGRLDAEVDEKFLELVSDISEKIYTVFVGVYNGYDDMIERYPELREKTSYLGFQEDILAINECADLYINPKRNGGGSSAAEALYMGSPVVSLDYGDVSVEVGPGFVVDSYKEMYDELMRYVSDDEYYKSKSEEGRKRAEYLMDTASILADVIRTAEESGNF